MTARETTASGDEKDAERAKSRASFLGPFDMAELDGACRAIREGFGEPPYLVGSVMTRPNFRDVDVRLILDDDKYAALAEVVKIAALSRAFTGYLRRETGLPVDFQIQQMTAANAAHDGPRNPLGVRSLRNFPGDGAPEQ